MNTDRRWGAGPLAVVGVGSVLTLTAVVHHAAEALTVGSVETATLSLLIDGLPALALIYAGYRLNELDFEPEHQWLAAIWCLGGIVVFTSAIGLTVIVRLIEDRTIAEPQFTLLVTASFGGLAGIVAGYYRARAVADATRARRAGDTLAFVNSLIRHDLRNDMQVIQAYAAEIEDDAPTNDGAVSEHAAIVREKATESFEHLETAGSLAKTVAGEADYEPIDLVEIVSDVAANVESATTATVTTDLPDRAPVVANAGLRSVVDNITENAVEHNDSADPRVSLTVEDDGPITSLVVSDNGPGIPADERPSAFEAGEETSSGGLRIAATLVDRYRGDLWIDESGGDGTTVVVELPSAETDDADWPVRSRPTPVGE